MMRSAGSIIARASSGSRSSISSVEPLRSANSAVTVLRSPSIFSGAEVSATRIGESFDGFDLVAAADAPSGAAHSPQNLNAGGFSNPQLAQRFFNGVAQLPQNLMPGGLSVLQLVQRILSTKFVEQGFGV